MISRALIERIPRYLAWLRAREEPTVSATTIAKGLGLGEVQVRKDLSVLSGAGKPRIGYQTQGLVADIERFLQVDEPPEAVVVGAGKLGTALLGYGGFRGYGVRIERAFDIDLSRQTALSGGKEILSIDKLPRYCAENEIKIGIITVPAEHAQGVADLMVSSGIRAVWNFAPVKLQVPGNVRVINEQLAISLSLLSHSVKEDTV